MAREMAAPTQREIDALLAGGISQSAAAAQLYDFRNPEKLSKEQVRGLQNIQQLVSSSLGQALSGRLRTLVEARFSVLEPGLANDYIAKIGERTCVAVADLHPLDGLVFVTVDSAGSFEMLNRVLGGSNKGRNKTPQRDLTPLELAVMGHIASDLVGALVEPWQRIVELQPEIAGAFSVAEMMQMLSPSAPVFAAWYEVSLFGITCAVTYCYPVPLLEQVAAKLAGQTLYREMGSLLPGMGTGVTPDLLMPVAVLLRAILGGVRLDAIDVGSLAEGDIVVLDQKVSDPLALYVGDHRRFACRPGVRGKHLAVEVIAVDGPEAIDAA